MITGVASQMMINIFPDNDLSQTIPTYGQFLDFSSTVVKFPEMSRFSSKAVNQPVFIRFHMSNEATCELCTDLDMVVHWDTSFNVSYRAKLVKERLHCIKVL